MKSKTIALLSLIFLLGLFAPSCNKASKAAPIIKDLYKGYRAASKKDAIRYLKWKNRIEQAERIYNNAYHTPCGTCNGYGVVYLVDDMGYPITDYAGNYQLQYCPACGGSGEY